MDKIKISDKFTYQRLLRFTLPSIIMMVFSSIYSVVDGLFVSNFVGKTAFASVNLIMPFLTMLGTIGFMIGSGGSALVAKTLGEGNKEKANQLFSMLIYILIAVGLMMTVLCMLYLPEVAELMGARGQMADDCIVYAMYILPALTFFLLQFAFQPLLVAAGKPKIGLFVTVGAGVTNMILDYIFIEPLGMGLKGAAIATAISQAISGIVPLLYFALPNRSSLMLTRFTFDGKAFLKTCTNGSSEMVTNLSMSIVTMLYNFQLMRYIGEDGVAAFGVIMYINFIFSSVFIGYSMGSAPIVSYNYGANDRNELQSVFRKSMYVIGISGFVLTLAAEILATPLANIFVGYDESLFRLTRKAFHIYSLAFLLMGFNVYASAFFTALNNGPVSALISFSRTLVFETSAVLLLPLLMGITGIWLSVVVAEMAVIIVSVVFWVRLRGRYGYA